MLKETKRRFELLVYTAIAIGGSEWCARHHRCWCGHLTHNDRIFDLRPWIEDIPGLFAIIAMMVVGLRNPFRHAWIIGGVGLLFVGIMFLDQSPFLESMILAALFMVQLWWLWKHVRNIKSSEQGVVGNRENATSSLRSGQSSTRLPTL